MKRVREQTLSKHIDTVTSSSWCLLSLMVVFFLEWQHRQTGLSWIQTSLEQYKEVAGKYRCSVGFGEWYWFIFLLTQTSNFSWRYVANITLGYIEWQCYVTVLRLNRMTYELKRVCSRSTESKPYIKVRTVLSCHIAHFACWKILDKGLEAANQLTLFCIV